MKQEVAISRDEAIAIIRMLRSLPYECKQIIEAISGFLQQKFAEENGNATNASESGLSDPGAAN